MAKSSSAAAAPPSPPVASPAPPSARHTLIPLEELRESPLNHRRTWGDMDELTASVRRQGVLQPVLARPAGDDGWELVFGHRRLRAAKAAGLAEIPAMVREMTDLEVVEAQVVENVQRQDVHPLEEAEGYEQLLAQPRTPPYTVDEIAAKVGKSKAYVYGRLKLTALCKDARKAFYDGTLTPSVALLVARIPGEDLQRNALKRLTMHTYDGAPVALRQASSVIQNEFMLQLGEAPWDKDDLTLVPGAGACTNCPKRTGNAPELFGDVKGANVCTDPKCFEEKQRAWAARRRTEAEAAGQKVIAGAEAKKIVEPYGDTLKRGSGLISLAERCWEDPKQRTYAQLLGKKAPIVLVEKPSGELVEAVERKAAIDILKEKGVKFASEMPSRVGAGDSVARERKRHALKRRTVELAITAIVNRAEARELDDDVVRFTAEAMLEHSWHDTAVDIVKRRAIDRGKKRPEEALAAAAKDFTSAQLRGLLVELLITRGAYFAYQDGHTNTLRWAAKLYRVDLEKAKTEAKAEVREREQAKKAKQSKGGARATVLVRWSTAEGGRVPKFVQEMTGLDKVSALVKRYGHSAVFQKGLPLPTPAPPLTKKHGPNCSANCPTCHPPSQEAAHG